MISEPTRQQLATLKIPGDRPLLICDVDDVVVDFIADFGSFLQEQELRLRPTSRLFHGEIVTIDRETYIGEQASMSLIDQFFAERTATMRPVYGAIESLNALAAAATVVFLTNLPHTAGDQRRQNMKSLGLPFPVITNSGPKGPAIAQMAAASNGTVVFIDDSPFFINSAHEHAPQVKLIHFLHHEDFAAFAPKLDFVDLRAHSWEEAYPFALGLLKA